MSAQSSPSSGGIGFFGLLAIVLITLKLTHYIDWSWWWVLAPLWAPFAVVLALVASAAAVFGMAHGLSAARRVLTEK